MSKQRSNQTNIFGYTSAASQSAGNVVDPTTGQLRVCRGIAFSTAGALVYESPEGDSITIASGVLAAGMIHPVQMRRVVSFGGSNLTVFF